MNKGTYDNSHLENSLDKLNCGIIFYYENRGWLANTYIDIDLCIVVYVLTHTQKLDTSIKKH